jgi:chromosome segregation ATPase
VKLLEFEFGTIMEFIVLGAIGIELFALYNHSKIDNRMDEHILDTERKLEKYDVLVQVLNNNISKLDEHLIRMSGYINNLDQHMNNLNEHMIRYDAHMTQYSEHMNNLDEHMIRYDGRLDEHVTRLDDLLWKFYTQRSENINDNQNPKINKESRSKS